MLCCQAYPEIDYEYMSDEWLTYHSSYETVWSARILATDGLKIYAGGQYIETYIKVLNLSSSAGLWESMSNVLE